MVKPPINWVRAFEVAARHRNLSRAASELGVTHGAVSRQVSKLEAHLAATLVRRSNTGLELTQAGARLQEGLQEGFGLIDRALEDLQPGVRLLTVTVLPSFAVHWLVARLGRFYAAHPDFEIRLLTTRRLVDLTREEVDLGLRYGKGRWDGLDSELVLEDRLCPVAAPELAGNVDWQDPSSYRPHIVMTDRVADHENWQVWFERAGVPQSSLSGLPAYDDTGVAMEAALQGQAIIMGRSSLVADYLTAGRLVRLSGCEIESPSAMYLTWRKGDLRRRDLRVFRDWLLAAARAWPDR